MESEGSRRELKRDTAILQEFDGSGSTDLLVLYFHLRDSSFDALNATEYTEQMIRYVTNGMVVSSPPKPPKWSTTSV